MTTTTWEALKVHQRNLIRKALDGSVFRAPIGSTAITALTGTAGALQSLPTGYKDVGYLTADGVTYGTSENTDETTSWGDVEPTRSDIVSRVTTLTFTAQETNRQTLEMSTGADLSAIAPATTNGGEVQIQEAVRPPAVYNRYLTISVDDGDNGQIYIARFIPRGKITALADQKQSASGETQYGVTLTAYKDDTLGYAVSHLFGGPGWSSLLVSMGFPAAV